nr:MAG TPA: Protein of unknown function (DUF722) [Caudoviricetes sp.]
MLKINDDTNRLTRAEFEDYRLNSGITDLQAEIIRLRYHDAEQPTVISICLRLNISTRKYNRELNRALLQIFRYTSKK